jgi:hypothetical protein
MNKNFGGDFFDNTHSYNGEVKEFIDTWNSHIWLPKVNGSDRQAKLVREALRRPFFKKNWRESFGILAKSPYLLRKRFRMESFLEPDFFDKIVDGLYLDDKYRVELPPPILDPNREETL